MKKKTSIIAIVMVFVLAFGLALCLTACDENKDTDNPHKNDPVSATVEYKLEGDSYTLVKMNDDKAVNFDVPATYEGKPVTAIGDAAFTGCGRLNSVTVPDSVKIVGVKAFTGCGKLESLTVPFVGRSADAADEKALLGYMFGVASYTGGTSIDQAYSSKTEDVSTYYLPTGLKTVTVTGSKISPYAFNNCDMLKTVRIGAAVAAVGDMAFADCKLTSVYIDSEAVAALLTAADACGGLLVGNPTLYIKSSITAPAFLDTVYPNKSTVSDGGTDYVRYGIPGDYHLEAELAELTQGLSIDASSNPDIPTSGGYCVGGFDSFKEGAAMTFKFDSDIAAEALLKFTLNPRLVEDYCRDTYTITLNGNEVTSETQFTCGIKPWWWYNWETYEIATVNLQAGPNILVISFHGNYGEPGSDRENTVDNGHNFDYVSFVTNAGITMS